MELIFKLFPFDSTVICPDANCREKVHGMVLIYGIILLLTANLCFQRSNYKSLSVVILHSARKLTSWTQRDTALQKNITLTD